MARSMARDMARPCLAFCHATCPTCCHAPCHGKEHGKSECLAVHRATLFPMPACHASLPYASLLWPCHASCHASLFCHCQRRCVSRRKDLLTIERFQMLRVGEGKWLQDRKHIVAEMRAPSSTFVQWNLCVNHTRVGKTEESKLPKGRGGTRAKKKVLKAAFDSVAASASTPGLVVGDLNLKPDEVDEVIAGHPGPHNLRFIGGPGAPYPYVSCCAARQGFGMPGFAMHLAMSLAMHLAMLPRHVARCMARGMARDWQEAC